MARREIEGFEVVSTTKQTGKDFFEPALSIRRLDSQQIEECLYCPTSQNVEARTQARAQVEADRWLADVESVAHFGGDWDMR